MPGAFLFDAPATGTAGAQLLLDFAFSGLPDEDWTTPAPATISDSLGTTVTVGISQAGSPVGWGIAGGVLRLAPSGGAGEYGLLAFPWSGINALTDDEISNEDQFIFEWQGAAAPAWVAGSLIVAGFNRDTPQRSAEAIQLGPASGPTSRMSTYTGGPSVAITAAAWWRSFSLRRCSSSSVAGFYDATAVLGAAPLVTSGPGMMSSFSSYVYDASTTQVWDVDSADSYLQMAFRPATGETADLEAERLRLWRIPASSP